MRRPYAMTHPATPPIGESNDDRSPRVLRSLLEIAQATGPRKAESGRSPAVVFPFPRRSAEAILPSGIGRVNQDQALGAGLGARPRRKLIPVPK
jgi:hypothetical protein